MFVSSLLSGIRTALPSRSVGKIPLFEFFPKLKYDRISVILATNLSNNIFTFGGFRGCMSPWPNSAHFDQEQPGVPLPL